MNGEGIDVYARNVNTKQRDFRIESRRLRSEVISLAESIKNNPITFRISNGIDIDVEITKSDLKTIVSKNTSDDKFNAVKNALAKDIKGYIKKAKFVGIRRTKDGKHPEAAYFAYYNRRLGTNTYLCLRKMKSSGKFKPYAIISKKMYDMGEK